MKRMYHPLHGYHYPWGAAQEADMRARGWIDEPEPVAPVVEPEAQPEAATTPEEVKRKPGRPKKVTP